MVQLVDDDVVDGLEALAQTVELVDAYAIAVLLEQEDVESELDIVALVEKARAQVAAVHLHAARRRRLDHVRTLAIVRLVVTMTATNESQTIKDESNTKFQLSRGCECLRAKARLLARFEVVAIDGRRALHTQAGHNDDDRDEERSRSGILLLSRESLRHR